MYSDNINIFFLALVQYKCKQFKSQFMNYFIGFGNIFAYETSIVELFHVFTISSSHFEF